MMWRVILFWLLAVASARADLPRHYTLGGASTASPLIKSIALPNGAIITNGYDGLARLTATALNNQWGHTLDGYGYGLDTLGLRTNIRRQLGLATNSVNINYDGIGEVTNWVGHEASGLTRDNETIGYEYYVDGFLDLRTESATRLAFAESGEEEVGNMVLLSNVITVAGYFSGPATDLTVNGRSFSVNDDFTYGAEIAGSGSDYRSTNVWINGSAVSMTNVFDYPGIVSEFNYDSAGNRTQVAAPVMSYDADNRLTNVYTANQWQAAFVYDGLGRKRIERSYTWSNSAWLETNETRMVYDGRLVLQEQDSNNIPQVTYTRGLDMSLSLDGAGGIGGLLARTDANGSTYYHADGNGNITALMDENQNIAARYEYTAFGQIIGQWDHLASANRYKFSSKELVPSTGLYDFGYRFYDPSLQSWLTRDPIGEAGGFNLYQFVGNDPVNKIDPWGLWSFSQWWYNFWHGPGNGSTPDPNSNLALRNASGTGVTPLTDENGNPVSAGQAVTDVGMAVPKGIAQAAMMIPFGPEEEAVAAAEDASRVAKAAEKCEKHHLLPRQFANNFKRVGLNPDDYTMDLPAAQHRLTPDGIHTGPAADSWNGQWKQFFQNNPNYSQQDVLDQLSSMQQQFGLK